MPIRRVTIHLVVPLCLVLVAVTAAGAARAIRSPHRGVAQPVAAKVARKYLAAKIHRLEKSVWQHQIVMGDRRSRYRSLASASLFAEGRALRYWRQKSAAVWRQFRHPPHLADWLCIQSGIKDGRWSATLEYLGGGYHVPGHGEGSWTTNGSTYDGGLQMDADFQRAYGPYLLRLKGPAYKWTAYEQMWVAEKAWKGRGFRPWPNTAAACGLL